MSDFHPDRRGFLSLMAGLLAAPTVAALPLRKPMAAGISKASNDAGLQIDGADLDPSDFSFADWPADKVIHLPLSRKDGTITIINHGPRDITIHPAPGETLTLHEGDRAAIPAATLVDAA